MVGLGKLKYHWNYQDSCNTNLALQQQHRRSDYNAPFPCVTGSYAGRDAPQCLCPRPGAARLITLAERMRLQCMPDGMSIGVCCNLTVPILSGSQQCTRYLECQVYSDNML